MYDLPPQNGSRFFDRMGSRELAPSPVECSGHRPLGKSIALEDLHAEKLLELPYGLGRHGGSSTDSISEGGKVVLADGIFCLDQDLIDLVDGREERAAVLLHGRKIMARTSLRPATSNTRFQWERSAHFGRPVVPAV
jgi:hypothetical protein